MTVFYKDINNKKKRLYIYLCSFHLWCYLFLWEGLGFHLVTFLFCFKDFLPPSNSFYLLLLDSVLKKWQCPKISYIFFYIDLTFLYSFALCSNRNLSEWTLSSFLLNCALLPFKYFKISQTFGWLYFMDVSFSMAL